MHGNINLLKTQETEKVYHFGRSIIEKHFYNNLATYSRLEKQVKVYYLCRVSSALFHDFLHSLRYD